MALRRRHGPRRRYLVMVRQPPGGPGLSSLLAERAASGPCSFHAVSLLRPVPFSAVLGSIGDPSSGLAGYPDIVAARDHDRRESLDVPRQWLRRFGGLGLEAAGEVSETGPLAAAQRAVHTQGHFDEVLVAERRLPVLHGIARAAGCDLPQRLQRRVHLPSRRVEP